MRDGWGRRHPQFESVVNATTPAAEQFETWWNGTLPLRIRAFVGPCLAPDALITSVRCIVRAGDGLVRCSNADGSHVMPGGRREPGETFEETAVREVFEETGWYLDPQSLRLAGWLHFEYLTPQPDDWTYPHPDFVHLVYDGTATARAQRDDGSEWSDTDGWETSSDIVVLDDLATAVDDLTRPFITSLS